MADLRADADDRSELRQLFIEEHSIGSIRRFDHAASAEGAAKNR